MIRTYKLLATVTLLAAIAVAAPALVTITQRIDRADGTVAKGSVFIEWQSFDTALGEHVQAGSKQVNLLPTGFLTVALAPNLGASPATTRYTVTYHLDLGTPQKVSWIVPASGPVTVTAIQSTALIGPSSIVALSQLNTSGATINQCLIFNGSITAWGSCSNAAQSVTSVFGRIGVVVAASADYTAAQVTNAVSKIAANTYSGGGLQDFSAMKLKPATSTVAGLPAASANTNVVYEVTDAVSVSDCTTGASTVRAWCSSDGTNWVPMSSAAANPNFSAVQPGTNNLGTFNVGTGSTWTYTGSGIINANKILGTTLTSLTGLIKMTAGVPSLAAAANVYGLWSGTCNNTTFLRGDGACINPAGGVTSVFGRTGAVVQVSGDYNAAQVTNAVDSTSTYSDPAWLTALLSTKLTFTALGDLVYGGTAGAGTRLAGNTTSTKKFLRQTGNGSVSAAPAWDTIVAGDIPTLNQSTSGNAATATALAANGTNCSSGQPALGVDASGNAEGCAALTAAQVTNAASKIAANAYTTGFQDFTLATHFAPINGTVASKPATCTVGEIYFGTDATPGQNWYFCTATNTWTQQLNAGSSSGGGVTVYSGLGGSLSGTLYFPVGGGLAPSGTEANVDVDSPAAATITNMYVQLSAALGVANTGTFTFRKNASSQSVTCIITGNSATSCSDTTHSFNVSQGDLLTVQAVFDGTIIVTPNVLIAAQFGNITASGTVNTGTIGQIGYFAANGSAISGLSQFATNAKTATYQVLQADFTACKTIPVASGTFTITLVASGAQPLDGQCIDVVNYGSGVVTIARSGQNINGGTASYLVQSGSALVPSRARVVSNGTDYFIEGGFTNPMTAAGDTIYAGTTGLPARLAGAAGIYRSSGTVPSYAELSGDVTTSGSNVTTLIANQKIRGVGASFDGGGSALTTSALAYVTVPFACTIAAYNVVIDTGTISFDVWKIATGTAKPAIGNSIISGTNWLSISSNTAIHSTTVSGFTSTTVTANDIFAFSIEAVSSATKASVTLQCNAS